MVSWSALFAAEELPQDGALNGKADDVVTGLIVALLVVGLFAAGWLRPLWPVLIGVLVIGVAVPVLYEAVRPTVCSAYVSGMDCIPESFSAVYAVPGLLVVLTGSCARRLAGLPTVPPTERSGTP